MPSLTTEVQKTRKLTSAHRYYVYYLRINFQIIVIISDSYLLSQNKFLNHLFYLASCLTLENPVHCVRHEQVVEHYFSPSTVDFGHSQPANNQSVSLPACLTIYLSICLSLCIFIQLAVCLPSCQRKLMHCPWSNMLQAPCSRWNNSKSRTK